MKKIINYSNPTINEYLLLCEIGTLASAEEQDKNTKVEDLTEEEFIW
ncbi:MAG: hypothetical protein ACI39U_03835 [Candidatus Cryptobacteroides sp.]